MSIILLSSLIIISYCQLSQSSIPIYTGISLSSLSIISLYHQLYIYLHCQLSSIVNYLYLCWQSFYYFYWYFYLHNRELFHSITCKKECTNTCTEDLGYVYVYFSSFPDHWVRMCMFICMVMILMSLPLTQTCHDCLHWTKSIYRNQLLRVSWHITYLYFWKFY